MEPPLLVTTFESNARSQRVTPRDRGTDVNGMGTGYGYRVAVEFGDEEYSYSPGANSWICYDFGNRDSNVLLIQIALGELSQVSDHRSLK